MDNELQDKLKQTGQNNPIDAVMKTILKSQAKCCVRARVKLTQIEDKEHEDTQK
ncbi:MAG: hypothetical protein WCK11_03935 [Candidatus Falkowbacteria bacterium]